MRIINKRKTVVDWGKPEGRIKLTVSGFELQSIIPTHRVVAEIDRIPSHHLAGLKEIRYDPTRETLTWLTNVPVMSESPHTKGLYLQGFRTIAIYNFNSEKQLFTVLFHELGHYVYYTIIDSTVKKKWVTEVHPIKRYVTGYASRNASEDFAESYAEFLLNPHNLVRIPQKYNFIRNEVFGGIPYHNHLNRSI